MEKLGRPADQSRPATPNRHAKINNHEQRSTRRPVHGSRLSGVVVVISVGMSYGVWLSNLHNGLLALAFTSVGAYVVFQRPGHREGLLFIGTGVVEGVMFLGRQVGHADGGDTSRWWAWLGVWLIAVALALTTLSVICFPDGRLPSPRWRWVAGAVLVIAAASASMSALWPVEYAAAGINVTHPINPDAGDAARALWDAIAHPAYVAFQVLWVVAVVVRWRSSGGHVRRQLAWLVVAAMVSAIALVVGLVVWGSALPGILSTALVPVAAGWAIVHGQHAAAYAALTWLSRIGPTPRDLPMDMARALAEGLVAPGAKVWMGNEDSLHVVGVWPDTAENIEATRLDTLNDSLDGPVRAVMKDGAVVGAITVDGACADPLSRAEARLLDDLTAQAALVIEHLNLGEVIARQREAGYLQGLSAREREVLELMARGLSNTAISEELHLSIKTVEPVVSTIFNKLRLHADAGTNRRVLAVLALLRSSPDRDSA